MKTIASRNTTTIALVRSGILGGFVATCVGSGGRRAASEKKRWRSYEFVNPVGSEMIIKRRLESGTSRGNAAARHNGLTLKPVSCRLRRAIVKSGIHALGSAVAGNLTRG
jgi:hypothetical protein